MPPEKAAASARTWQLVRAISFIMTGCMINNLVLEVIVSKKKNEFADPGAGGLMTLLQFLLVTLLSTPYAIRWRGFSGSPVVSRGKHVGAWNWVPLEFLKTVVPLRHYLGMTVLFFSMSYLNNWAFAFNISQPLHMVFRSSSLMVAYVIGAAFLGKRYTLKQFIAVLLLTAGAISATCAEAFIGDTASEAVRRRLAAAGTACVGCGDGAQPLPSAVAAAAAAIGGALASPSPASVTAAVAAALGAANATTTSYSIGSSAGGGLWLAAGLPDLVLDEGRLYLLRWLVGVAILTLVLILQTLLSNYQNWASATYGKAPQEGMFWAHAMSLPAFILTSSDLRSRVVLWSASPATSTVLAQYGGGAAAAATAAVGWSGGLVLRAAGGLLPSLIGRLPIMWTYMLVNVVSQYLCISGVYHLTGWADPLTVNVALTVRKFVSLMLSIWVFNNTFTPWHWGGTVFVFAGAILYGYWSAGGATVAAADTKREDASVSPSAPAYASSSKLDADRGGSSSAVAIGGGSLHHRGGGSGMSFASSVSVMSPKMSPVSGTAISPGGRGASSATAERIRVL